MKRAILLLFIFTVFAGIAFSQEAVLLWPEGAPGAKGSEVADKPTITAFIPPIKSAGIKAVVVFPGGGYGHLAFEKEGTKVARWLNSFGVAAFVVSYRHKGKGYQYPAPLDDAQRAVRLVRFNAEKYHIDPESIGVLGFSAGGHLASTVATLHGDKYGISGDADDPVNKVSSRPDFAVLCYPVISMNSWYTHKGSKRKLLGEDPDEKLVKLMSTELQVSEETPPIFLIHANDDKSVPPENSVAFYSALRKAKIDGVMHIFKSGGHGFGLGRDGSPAKRWPDLCKKWIQSLQR